MRLNIIIIKKYNKIMIFNILFNNYVWYFKYLNFNNIDILIKLINYWFYIKKKLFINLKISWLHILKIIYLKLKIIS